LNKDFLIFMLHNLLNSDTNSGLKHNDV